MTAGAGFFPSSTVKQRQPQFMIPRCGDCGLLETCRTGNLPPRGVGNQILFVGTSPGWGDDYEGKYGKGEHYGALLNYLGMSDETFSREYRYTTALACPVENKDDATAKRVDDCRPNLNRVIEEMQPDVIVPLGYAAVRAVLAPYFRESTGKEQTWVGWQIPVQKMNRWVCPTFGMDKICTDKPNNEHKALQLLFRRHLEAAQALSGRPWDSVPDWSREIEVLQDANRAARWIDCMIKRGKPVAFDYETNCLKPDRPEARIVSVGFCSGGDKTMACPFIGPVVDATRRFLQSDLPKIGANNKFEERWSRSKVGTRVQRWVWDCMLSAHHLDNRKDITSVKFQAFVRLGISPWDYAVAGYFEAGGATCLNRVDQIDWTTLLKYNALDAIVEYKVAEHQKREMLCQT